MDPAAGLMLLPGFATAASAALAADIARVSAGAPFRHMTVRGGGTMSAAMTNCGESGWVTDAAGYRYTGTDPVSRELWPAMPAGFAELAGTAAATVGFAGFAPDCCLLNRYGPGGRMGLHRDSDEQDFSQPIVSVSLGLPATFLFGGRRRADPVARTVLASGDVVVWGGPARLAYHGVAPVAAGHHPLFGPWRFNLTFRRAVTPLP